MNEPFITLSHISKSFTTPDAHHVSAVHDVSLSIEKGEFFVILGPSGCGKSTLLRMLVGLAEPTSGKLTFADTNLRDKLGFVFQQFALLPWLTVYQNVELGLLDSPLSEVERHDRIMLELETLELAKFKDAHPRDLSGGMRQRVGIARAFVINPELIVLDEPFSELDSFTAESLRQELLAIWQKRKPTIVMVTHLIPEALELADRIAVMTNRPGTIETIVHNTLPRPRQMRSQEFFDLEDKLYNAVKV